MCSAIPLGKPLLTPAIIAVQKATCVVEKTAIEPKKVVGEGKGNIVLLMGIDGTVCVAKFTLPPLTVPAWRGLLTAGTVPLPSFMASWKFSATPLALLQVTTVA